MKIQKKLFTLRDAWPWALVLVIALALTCAAFGCNLTNLDSPTVVVQLAILCVVDITMVALTWYRFSLREEWVFRWNSAFQTSQNVAIIYDTLDSLKTAGLVKPEEDRYNASLFYQIDKAIDDCIAYWTKWAVANKKLMITNVGGVAFQMVDALRGGAVYLTAGPISVKYLGLVRGVQEGNSISCSYAGLNTDQLLNLVRHEVSHLCLSSIGVNPGSAGEAHHQVFSEAKVEY